MARSFINRNRIATFSQMKKYYTMTLSEKKLFDICSLYHKVKPALKVAKALLFWKPKWRDALQMLMNELDQACAE